MFAMFAVLAMFAMFAFGVDPPSLTRAGYESTTMNCGAPSRAGSELLGWGPLAMFATFARRAMSAMFARELGVDELRLSSTATLRYKVKW